MDSVTELLPRLRKFVGDAGVCSEEKTLEAINNARQLLWNKTDYETTMDYVCFRCPDSCLTLPSQYKQIRLAWMGNEPMLLGNEWYQSIPQVGILNPNHSCHKRLVEVGGRHTTFDNISEPSLLMIQGEDPQDAGVQLTFFVQDQYSSWRKDPITIAKIPNFAKGKILSVQVGNVIKPRTKGRVRLYAYNPNTKCRSLLAIYMPYDINPSFRRYKVTGVKCCDMTIYVKKKFLPLTDINELCEFTADAMIHALNALNAQENKHMDEYTTYLALAVAELNREKADLEQMVGSPMRLFFPQTVENLIGDGYYWGGLR